MARKDTSDGSRGSVSPDLSAGSARRRDQTTLKIGWKLRGWLRAGADVVIQCIILLILTVVIHYRSSIPNHACLPFLRVVCSVTTACQGLTWLFPAMAFCWCIQPAHKKDLRRIVVRECAVVQPQRISLVLPYRATTGIPLAGEIISHREAALPQLLVAASWLRLRTFLPLQSTQSQSVIHTSTE